MRFHDPRAEAIAERSQKLTNGLHDEQLSQHLCYGGMHPLEAHIKIEIMVAKAAVANHYRAAIRRWQRRRGISSLEWETISYCGYSVDVPTINDQLSPTKGDVRLLRKHKARLIEFLSHVQAYFKLWQWNPLLSNCDKYPWVEVQWEDKRAGLETFDWLVISHCDGIIQMHYADGQVGIPYNTMNVYAYATSPTRCSDENCFWLQLNNSRPSW